MKADKLSSEKKISQNCIRWVPEKCLLIFMSRACSNFFAQAKPLQTHCARSNFNVKWTVSRYVELKYALDASNLNFHHSIVSFELYTAGYKFKYRSRICPDSHDVCFSETSVWYYVYGATVRSIVNIRSACACFWATMAVLWCVCCVWSMGMQILYNLKKISSYLLVLNNNGKS